MRGVVASLDSEVIAVCLSALRANEGTVVASMCVYNGALVFFFRALVLYVLLGVDRVGMLCQFCYAQ